METDDERAVSLVVMELGAAWPSWLHQFQSAANNSIVEVQPQHESYFEFVERVKHRLNTLVRRDLVLVKAAIVTNTDTGEAATLARQDVARALLAWGPEFPRELVLTAGDESQISTNHPIRHQLISLAGRLCETLQGTDRGVSVRFGPAASQSGVISSVEEASGQEPAVAVGDEA